MKQTISYNIGNNLYLSINNRCTLLCAFCPKTLGTTKVHEYDLTINHKPDITEVISSIGDPKKYNEIVFCGYGEPTLRLNLVLEVAKWIKNHGGIVRINTDGLANLVYKKNILPKMQGIIDKLSISMNAQNQEIYDKHCLPQLTGSFHAMLDFLYLAPQYIDDVTATAIDGLEGVDINKCQQIAKKFGVKFRARYLGVIG